MNTTTRTNTTERLGQALGHRWRAYVRGERRASNWLISKGVPTIGTVSLVWAVKPATLAVLLYASFGLVLVLVGMLFVSRGSRRSSDDFSQPRDELEWSSIL